MSVDADFDVIVIGAGVVGLAIARAWGLRRRRVLVLESEERIGSGISSRNSQVIHAGLYYPEGSIKARTCVLGRGALYEYCEKRGVPYARCGKLVVATEQAQHPRIEALYRQALRNGVTDLRWLSGTEARALEPELSCTLAFLSPSTGIVDTHALMTSLAADLEAHDGLVALRTTFLSAVRKDGLIAVTVGSGQIESEVSTRWLVNSAGLAATSVARAIEGLPEASIRKTYFAKGNYFAVAGRPFSHLVYPLPVPGGLGVHATLQLDGQVLFGPDVQWVETPNFDVDPTRADRFYAAIRAYFPKLPDGALQPAYAGLRPKISGPGEPAADFIISGEAEHGCPGLINLFGIESPGLTASLALGEVCADLARD